MKRQFLTAFRQLTYERQPWQVWTDFIDMAACAISNRVDSRRYEQREQRYLDTIKRYESKHQPVFAELLAYVVQALEDNPEQDFLGQLFMELELSNRWKGQFFTPYSICRLMADIAINDLEEQLQHKGFVSMNDCACGAGALLIAYANAARDRGINYQNHVLFGGQDISQTAAQMCYLQLSLLGCAGYVIVGNTISHPGLHPENEVWYTPMYFSRVWHWRRVFRYLEGSVTT